MLRINLLPNYIHERRSRVYWLGGGIALIAVTVLLFIFAFMNMQGALDKANQRLDTSNTYNDKYQAADKSIQSVNTEIADTKAKQDFIGASQNYNKSWPYVFEAIARDTSPDILLHSVSIDARDRSTVHVTGFCQTEDQLVHWWMSLRNDKAKFQSVTISLPPHPYPSESNNTRNGMGMGFGNIGGGMPGGFGSGGRPSLGMMGGAPSGMSGFGAGGRRGKGAFGMPSGMTGFGGGGGAPGIMGGGNSSGAVSTAEISGKQGINFVATVVLTSVLTPPVSTPVWPAQGSSGNGGMTGGMGMGMGGFPGMPAGVGGFGGMPPGAGMSGGGMGEGMK